MNPNPRIVAVEDTYGVRFHNTLISWLIGRGLLCSKHPRVRRLPAKKCNHALYRKLAGIALASSPASWRILVVIDSEGRSAEEAAEQDVLSHVPEKFKQRFRVAVVEPFHEAWACLGLNGPRSTCRDKKGAIRFLERTLKGMYEKRMLEKIPAMKTFDFARLQGEKDFEAYIKNLKWLLEC